MTEINPIAPETPVLVVTDLDGTLLDHHDYSYAPASPLLAELERAGVPVIFNTSKTRAELLSLRRELHNRHPFIVENGSAVFIPRDYFDRAPADTRTIDDYWVHELGARHADIRRVLGAMRRDYVFEGFSDWTAQQLILHAQLTPDVAELARQREYSEPLVWRDSDAARERFARHLAGAGLSTLQGGRYLHVLGKVDKGDSLRWLRQCYSQAWDQPVTVIALGDSPNDSAMLAAADVPVIIRSPVRQPPPVDTEQPLLISDACGPEGWAETLGALLAPRLSQR